MKKREVPSLSEPCCGSCAHFIRHHVFQWKNRKARYLPCGCGDCMYRNLRRSLTPYTASCKKYKPQPIRFRLKRRVSWKSPKQPKNRKNEICCRMRSFPGGVFCEKWKRLSKKGGHCGGRRTINSQLAAAAIACTVPKRSAIRREQPPVTNMRPAVSRSLST